MCSPDLGLVERRPELAAPTPDPGFQPIAHRAFAPEATACSEARCFAAEVLNLEGDPADIVGLAVSELAANAVLHARTPFIVAASRRGTTVRVDVVDGSSRLPECRAVDLDMVTGRGLLIVAATCDRWGYEPTPEGKRVWCELDLP
jgi:anti-sigma regulatory factor (Ser/Thr protein kinase)